MQGSIYDPVKTADFEKTKINFSGQSISLTCEENATSEGDLELADDYLMTGGMLLVKGGGFSDRVYVQIVHPTYGVVNEFISGYRICEDMIKQFDISLNYPAKLPAGLKIRCKYVAGDAVGTRDVAVNLYLHKVLI